MLWLLGQQVVYKCIPFILAIENVLDCFPRSTESAVGMGDIAGDLSSKRGRINGTEASSQGMVTISGQVPLGEMENYQSQLKSVTGGEGAYNMELSHYDPVPALLQKRLMEEFKPSVDDD